MPASFQKHDSDCISLADAGMAVAVLGADVIDSKGMRTCDEFRQHGSTSVRTHCVAVAKLSVSISRSLRLELDEKSLVRAALLHDYFLYDWHDRSASRPRHATMHPRYALENAERDFALNEMERGAILTRMFPITLHPPQSAVGWVICFSDKLCAFAETYQAIVDSTRRLKEE